MPPRKTPVRRKAKTAKLPTHRTPKTKALAISDPVKREALGPSMFDSQLALFGVFALGRRYKFWSPAGGVLGGIEGPPTAPRASKRKRPAKAR